MRDASARMLETNHVGFQFHAASARPRPVRCLLPHHPRPEAWIMELLDERLDNFLPVRPEEGVLDRHGEREALDALRRPLGADLRARNTTDLLSVGLEEDGVQSAPEAVGDPFLKRVLARVGKDLRGEVTQRDPRAGEQAEIGERLKGLEGVIVKLAFVENARDARAEEKIIAADFAPEPLDLAELVEEAMPADVEGVALVLL